MATNAKLTNDPLGNSVASRPNIAFSIGVCSRFQSNPKVSHLNDVKRIIKYVVELVIMDCSIAKSQICLLLVFLI